MAKPQYEKRFWWWSKPRQETCRNCGAEFIAHHVRKRYCTDRCKREKRSALLKAARRAPGFIDRKPNPESRPARLAYHRRSYRGRSIWVKRGGDRTKKKAVRISFTLPEGLREWYYDTLEQRGCTSTELCRAALRFKREGVVAIVPKVRALNPKPVHVTGWLSTSDNALFRTLAGSERGGQAATMRRLLRELRAGMKHVIRHG